MKTILPYFLILFFVISKADSVKAQTTVIDYTNWTSATGCNIFGTGPLVNGLEHRTVLGTPTYETVNKSIVLQSDISNGSTRGTSFRINYNFKKGYTYKVTIKAWRQKGTSTSSDIRLRSELVNSSTTTSQCAGPEFNNNFGGSTATSQYNDINTGTDKDYIYNFNSLQSTFSHLIVGALINFNSTIQIAYIKKITIQETAPELVLTPTTLATTCGFSTTQTFTVTNPSGIEGITSYEWNLGSASNGWLYNGNPAPQNITTFSNSLNLTTVSGATTVNNVAVTIKVNNVIYKSYTCNVTKTNPILTIAGPAQFCTSEIYTIPNLPGSATVVWTATGSIAISGANNINPVSVVKVENGTGTLSAVVTACNQQLPPLTNTIEAGVPVITSMSQGPGVMCAGDYATFNVYATGATTYDWTYDTATMQLISSGVNSNQLILQAKSNFDGGYAQVIVSKNCGTAQTYGFWSIGRICNGGFFAYAVYPNPTGDELTISYQNEEPLKGRTTGQLEKEFSVKLLNNDGSVLKSAVCSDEEVKLNVRDISNGTYYLHITESKETIKKQIIIKH